MMAEAKAQSSKQFIDSDRVEGAAVYTLDGKHIGIIKRFLIERQSGRIAYVVMSFGGFLDFAQETFTVPWAKLSYDVGLDGYRTDITESELRDVPRFAHTDENASLEEAQEEELHAHFRIPPYWRGAV
jgi:alpha-glucosidase (family GH31 glycosyl hydrolase)